MTNEIIKTIEALNLSPKKQDQTLTDLRREIVSAERFISSEMAYSEQFRNYELIAKYSAYVERATEAAAYLEVKRAA